MSAASAKEHVDVPALLAELWPHEAGAHLEPAAQMGSADRKAFTWQAARLRRLVESMLVVPHSPHDLVTLDPNAASCSRRSRRDRSSRHFFTAARPYSCPPNADTCRERKG